MGTDLSRLESLDTLSRIDFTSQVEGKWLDFANEIASGNPSFGVGSNVRSWLVAADMLQVSAVVAITKPNAAWFR